MSEMPLSPTAVSVGEVGVSLNNERMKMDRNEWNRGIEGSRCVYLRKVRPWLASPSYVPPLPYCISRNEPRSVLDASPEYE